MDKQDGFGLTRLREKEVLYTSRLTHHVLSPCVNLEMLIVLDLPSENSGCLLDPHGTFCRPRYILPGHGEAGVVWGFGSPVQGMNERNAY